MLASVFISNQSTKISCNLNHCRPDRRPAREAPTVGRLGRRHVGRLIYFHTLLHLQPLASHTSSSWLKARLQPCDAIDALLTTASKANYIILYVFKSAVRPSPAAAQGSGTTTELRTEEERKKQRRKTLKWRASRGAQAVKQSGAQRKRQPTHFDAPECYIYALLLLSPVPLWTCSETLRVRPK